MALTGENLVDEVQALLGRTGDTELITDARVTRWLNEAQEKIAEECPSLLALQFDVTASHTCLTTTNKYAVNEISANDPTEAVACWVHSIYYMDGANSYPIKFLHEDEFDEEYVDLTDTSWPLDRPSHWTRRGQYIELAPLTDSGYSGDGLRFIGNRYCEDFTTNDSDTSDLSRADDGLIKYAVAQGWAAIGQEERRVLWQGYFDKWLDDYKAKNDVIHAWDGNLYGDGL